MKLLLTLFLFITTLLFQTTIQAKAPWGQWVAELKEEALSQGINADLFDELFANIAAPDLRVQHYHKTQPEHRLDFEEYKQSRVDNYKILIGRKEFKKHRDMLESVANRYNVNVCYIVALWGMETSYGRYMGKFPVVKSLATLAYKSNREDKFRKELLLALHMLNDNQVTSEQFKGEWAGATGQPQFLPSSWYEYAVDYDRCGRKNIWTSYPDVFASIANYLVKNNWNDDEPVMIPVTVPSDFDLGLIGRSHIKKVKEWQALGVTTESGNNLPYANLSASIIQPEGGTTYLVYPNFNVLLTYNNSIYYAGTVEYLAESICGR